MLVICNRSALLNNIPVVLGMDRDEEGQGRNVSSLCHSWDTHFIPMAMTIPIQFELSFLMKNPLGSLQLWESFSLCSAGLNFPCRAVHVFSSQGKEIKALLMRDVGEKRLLVKIHWARAINPCLGEKTQKFQCVLDGRGNCHSIECYWRALFSS